MNHTNISSDINELTYRCIQTKKSPNKLYGITPFALFIPLHAKLENDSVIKTFNFEERLCNVKVKGIYAFIKKHIFINWVTAHTEQFKM